MKLGYLNGALGTVYGNGVSLRARAENALELGYTEQYVIPADAASSQTVTSANGPEWHPVLHVLPDVSVWNAPKLVRLNPDQHFEPSDAPDVSRRLLAPATCVQDVREHVAKGYAPLSASWSDVEMLARHWAAYVTSCTHAERPADPENWHVARTVFVHPDAGKAEAMVKDPSGPCHAYYRRLLPDGAGDTQVDALMDACVMYGTQPSVMSQLNELCAASAAFGTLALVDHNWPDAALARQSMTLFASAILPTYQAQQRHYTRKQEHA